MEGFALVLFMAALAGIAVWSVLMMPKDLHDRIARLEGSLAVLTEIVAATMPDDSDLEDTDIDDTDLYEDDGVIGEPVREATP